MSIVNPHRPHFSEQESEKLAHELYGLTGRARQLPGERDQNFYLRTESGEGFVLKISNTAERQEVLDFQNKLLDHVAVHFETGACPRVCVARSGQAISTVDGPANRHFVRLLTYLPGTFLAEVQPHSPDLLRSLGQFFGRLDQALSSFFHPAMHRDLYWDLKKARTMINRYLEHVTRPERRAIVEQLLWNFETYVIPALPELRMSVIHSDGNDYNILVDSANGSPQVAGLIDFGDALYGYTIGELAIVAAYAMLDKADPIGAAAQLAAGYHKSYPLTEQELELLFHLICARLCMSVTISAHQQKLEPENEYLRISEQPAWRLLTRLIDVNPASAHNLFRQACGLSARVFGTNGLARAEILERRQRHLGPSLSISYQKPLTIVRGWRQYLYDDTGKAYLDAVNNVPHVGHSHPRVVKAAQEQMARLNTNTRYLHPNLVEYAERLCATLPEPLRVCFFVCSGSEANDLALRLARTHTGQTDVITVDGAYHGNLTSLIEISPYKFDGPGGSGAPAHVQKVLMPDGYRGPYKSNDPQAGEKYAHHVQTAIEYIQQQGRGVAAFICESVLGCGGQLVLPDGYLETAFEFVRAAGGVCIADEVQVGFGRVGTHFWGFETQGVVPDIVTLGKPIGNGHPLAAVVTTPEIAASFNNGMEYFNTFGGNPVSCTVGLAVLDVIETERLQENALNVGRHLLTGLERLKDKYPLIGDVRGLGLFVGIELVLDRETLAPAAETASFIANRMKEHGILISTDGPLHNVLKIKPPLVFSRENADFLIDTLDKILETEVLQQNTEQLSLPVV